jgi:esterase/lipase
MHDSCFQPLILSRTTRQPSIRSRPGLNSDVPAWLHRVEGSSKLAIFVPGAVEGSPMTGRHDYAPLARALAHVGVSLLLVQMASAQFTHLAIFDECADDIKAAVDWAQADGFDWIGLVGISMGGARVCYFNSVYPSPALRTIVLLATIKSSYLASVPIWTAEERARQDAVLEKCRALVSQGRGWEIVDGELLGKRIIQTAEAYLSFFGALTDMNASTVKFFDAITVPTAIIHAREDNAAPPAHAQEMYDLLGHLPHRRLVWLEDSDHQTLLPGDQALRTSRAIADWFADVIGRQSTDADRTPISGA